MSREHLVLACDVDSTVWDTGACVRAATFEVTGEMPDPATIFTWTHVLDTYGEPATTSIFDRVFDPVRIREREPYPGAPGVLRALQKDPGVRIHFVTRNDPGIVSAYLETWLKENFGPEVGLTVTTGDKLGILRDLGAFGLVDDRPETLARAADAGLWAATKLQPWNRDLVAEKPDVHGFSDWHEVPSLIQGWIHTRSKTDRSSNRSGPPADIRSSGGGRMSVLGEGYCTLSGVLRETREAPWKVRTLVVRRACGKMRRK